MGLSIAVLGELVVCHDDQAINLPASKRTRALLAYLVLTARPHRRERLCEVFWELPNDPRGALRWCLSKLRPLVNMADSERLVADRERVSLDTSDVDVDILMLRQQSSQPEISLSGLKKLAGKLAEPLLDGLDLPDQRLYQQWLEGERASAQTERAAVVGRLAAHPELALPERIEWGQLWLELDPYNTRAATTLLSLLDNFAQYNEMNRLQILLQQRFRRAGIAWSAEKRFTAAETQSVDPVVKAQNDLLNRQKISFCTARDGVRIAYATVGKLCAGAPAIVKAANWLSHLELDWEAPIWSPLYRDLARDHQFIRYDERGNGLSDWEVKDLSFAAFVTDLETVVEATGQQKFALLGISQGAAVSIAYAVKHPQQVSHLILFGGYAAGWRIGATPQVTREREAVMTLTQSGWGQDNPAYRQIFSSTFMPSASAEELAWFNEFQRLTTSPDNAVRFLSVFGSIDVRELLGQISVPTLVLHSKGDRRIPVSVGRDLAASIPNAEFVSLDSDGHLLLGRESASKDFVDTIRRFIARA